MADRYFDLNGSTAGFGTLTGAWNTTSAFWSTSSAGTAVPGTFTFTNADRAFFGAAGTTATAGTATIADGVTVTLNGITTANLAGLQTIARTTSGALAFAGTTPSLVVGSAGGLTISAPVALNAATTVNNSSAVTLSGQLTGTGTLTKTGASDLFLTGAANTNSGAVTVNNGIVWLASDNSGTPNQLASVSSIALNSPGQLVYNGATSPATVSASISGGGTLVVATTNGVTFSGDLTSYTEALYLYMTNASGSTTKATASSVNAIPKYGVVYQTFPRTTTGSTATWEYTGSGNYTSAASPAFNIVMTTGVAGQTFVLSNASSSGAALSLNGTYRTTSAFATTLQINVAGTSGGMTLSGNFTQPSGVLALTKTGTGPLTLTGTSALTGVYTVSAGTLDANSTTALGAASSTAAISVTSGATLSVGAALNYSSPGRTTTISGVGVTGVEAGCLVLANAGPINLGAINATNNTYVRGTTTTQLTSAISWSGSGGLRLGAATGTTATFSGAISVSSGTLTAIFFGRSNNPDLGTVVLGTTNTFAAPAQIDFGTLSVSADNNLGTAPGAATAAYLIVGGSTTLATTATFTLNANRGIALGPASGSGTGTISVASSTTLTYGGVIANNSAGAGKLTKTEAGTLKLTGANTHTGGTDINAGVVQAGNVQALGTSGTVTLGASGTLQTLTAGGQNGKLTVAALNNSAGGIIRIGG